MINENTIKRLKSWFSGYTKSVYTGREEIDRNIKVKIDHTHGVCREAVNISEALGLDRDLVLICETAALLHDAGRFEQFVRYNTFVDKLSEDHAALSVKLIKREKILAGLTPPTRSIIHFAVQYHNKAALPENCDNPDALLVLQVLRDADKIDIYRVLTDYYQRPDRPRNSGIELGLPDTPSVSVEILKDISRKSIVNIDHIKTFNDFKALQMSWIFDINFDYTFNIIKKRRYLELISRAISDREASKKLYSTTSEYLENATEYVSV